LASARTPDYTDEFWFRMENESGWGMQEEARNGKARGDMVIGIDHESYQSDAGMFS
jgi:hypothetical protein